MVFKRREKLHWVESIRSYVLPRAGWKRSLTYIGHRLKRLPDSPTRISRGLAYGVFASWSPFFGFHIIYAMLLGKFFRGNLIAAAAGTFFGTPLTFPFIIGGSLKLGNFLLGRDAAEHDMKVIGKAFKDALHALWLSFKSLFGMGQNQMAGMGDFASEVMLPYFIGGTILGIAFAIPTFYLAKPLIVAYQALRQKKLAQKLLDKSDKG